MPEFAKMPVTDPNHVVVVDDDADIAASVARLLKRNGYEVSVFTAPRDLLEALPAQAPDCVLTDVMMDDIDGFGLAEKVHQHFPSTALIFMTAWPSATDAVTSFQKFKGVNYIQKPMLPDAILEAVKSAVEWSRPRKMALAALEPLTGREREVLGLMAEGHSNKQIAHKLELSQKTIEYHRASLMSKMGSADLPTIYANWRLVNDIVG